MQQHQSPTPTLIGAAEACEILGIDRSTLTRRIQLGVLAPFAKLSGPRGAYIFELDAIKALAAEHTEAGVA